MQATGSHCYLIVNNAITKRFLVKQPLSDWFHLTSQSKNTTPTPSATCSCLTSNMGDYYQAICAWCPARNSHSFDVFLVVWRKNLLFEVLIICSHLFVANSVLWFLIICVFVSWYLLKMTLSSCVLCALFLPTVFFSCKPMIHPNVNNVKTSVTVCL